MTQRTGGQGGQEWGADLSNYLEGMSYPQNRQGLMRHLEQQNAPQQVRQIVQNLPERQYSNMADVMRAMNEAQPGQQGQQGTRGSQERGGGAPTR